MPTFFSCFESVLYTVLQYSSTPPKRVHLINKTNITNGKWTYSMARFSSGHKYCINLITTIRTKLKICKLLATSDIFWLKFNRNLWKSRRTELDFSWNKSSLKFIEFSSNLFSWMCQHTNDNHAFFSSLFLFHYGFLFICYSVLTVRRFLRYTDSIY